MAVGSTPRGSDTLPLPSVLVPGFAAPTVLQGSTLVTTDVNNNVEAPGVFADQIQAAILNGKGFVYSTGLFATATNPSLIMALSVFNPSASGKSIWIYSIKWTVAAANTTLNYRITSVDPAFANVITAQNLKGGGAVSVASVTSAANAATASVAVTGTQQDFAFVPAQTTYEYLTMNTGVFLPAGVASGVVAYGTVAVAAQNWGATIRGVEV